MRALIAFRAPALAGVVAGGNKATWAQMAGAVQHALFNEDTGSYWRLDPEEQPKIGWFDPSGTWHWGTVIDVDPAPTAGELAMVGVTVDPETGKRDRLLGLFTGDLDSDGNLVEDPPPRIQLFASEIVAAGYDPVDVANHEIGHRLRYNDEHEPAPESTFRADRSLPAGENPCAFCATDDWLATSERALYGLRERAHMQHRIPAGMGGRIPEVRERLERAQLSLDRAAMDPWAAGRQGEIRQLRSLIAAAQEALEGEQITPEDVSRAHAYAARAWDAGVDLGHGYFASLTR